MTRHRLQRGNPPFFSVLAALRAVFQQQNGDGRAADVIMPASAPPPYLCGRRQQMQFIELASASHGQRICDASHLQSVPFGPGA